MYELRGRLSYTSLPGGFKASLASVPQPSSGLSPGTSMTSTGPVPPDAGGVMVNCGSPTGTSTRKAAAGATSLATGAPAAKPGSLHTMSLRGAAKEYHQRLSVTDGLVNGWHAALASRRRSSSSMTSTAADAVVRRLSSSTGANHPTAAAYEAEAPFSVSDGASRGDGVHTPRASDSFSPISRLLGSIAGRPSRTSDVGCEGLGAPKPARFPAALRQSIGVMSALNEKRVGLSPAADAVMDVVGVLSARRSSGQVGQTGTHARDIATASLPNRTSEGVRRSRMGSATIRIRTKCGTGPRPQRPSLTPQGLTMLARSADTRPSRGAARAVSLTSFLAMGDAIRRADVTADQVDFSDSVEIEDDELVSASLSWSKLQRGIAMRAVDEEEGRMYVRGVGDALGSDSDGVAHKRHVLVKKPVLLSDSFADSDIDTSDSDDE